TQAVFHERAKHNPPNATFEAVEIFLNSPRYDEIVAELSVTKEKNDAQPTVSKATPASEIEGHLANVNEILLVHDDRVGSA
ncbi:PTS mannitol transporter subunit IICBA, partial [Enterococcus faecalis]